MSLQFVTYLENPVGIKKLPSGSIVILMGTGKFLVFNPYTYRVLKSCTGISSSERYSFSAEQHALMITGAPTSLIRFWDIERNMCSLRNYKRSCNGAACFLKFRQCGKILPLRWFVYSRNNTLYLNHLRGATEAHTRVMPSADGSIIEMQCFIGKDGKTKLFARASSGDMEILSLNPHDMEVQEFSLKLCVKNMMTLVLDEHRVIFSPGKIGDADLISLQQKKILIQSYINGTNEISSAWVKIASNTVLTICGNNFTLWDTSSKKAQLLSSFECKGVKAEQICIGYNNQEVWIAQFFQLQVFRLPLSEKCFN